MPDSLLRAQVVDTDKYDVVCVSPRNHFVFTPMLPSSAIGTVEFRSLLEPIRISNPFVTCAAPSLPLQHCCPGSIMLTSARPGLSWD